LAARLVTRFNPISARHAHAHPGAIGFCLMLIVGASCKPVPMFTLSERQNERRAGWSVALFNLGRLGAFVTILLQSPLKSAFALVMIASLRLYGLEIKVILRVRDRRSLDWGMKCFRWG
jgi:hypothetical protein